MNPATASPIRCLLAHGEHDGTGVMPEAGYAANLDNPSFFYSFFAERAAFMRQLGTPVLLEDFNGFGFDMVLFIFEDGDKGELALAKASHFLHIHGGAYRALVDKRGLLR